MTYLLRRLVVVCAIFGSTAAATAGEGHGSAAQQLWEQGQAAMRQGRAAHAVRCYEESLAADPGFARAHLSIAAALLELGEDAKAGPHLALYLSAHPDHLIIRVHYAELLLRLEQRREARIQFRRFAADCPDDGEERLQQLIHCHSRLMEIAEAEEDVYGEHLHRGIGLFLLARQRAALGEGDGELPAEGLLCKAAAELTQASGERPAEAQPYLYLYEVWSRLDQRRPALRSLRAADAAAPFSYLTAAEQNGLQLAHQRHQPATLLK